ncbi:hypothetical protein AMAG_01383 [Allomyces macrogynus ATCC 38327]|uniref:Uncharacterized protein n=1 Tax=Allomyces macrogynus (strain ATCC 38327) TaxID=578462 RepID=A0A0L0RZM3_ALLM3|nr:hypothetical protein AMAG_01383 [Allomyces macrogynus ATCC 38327]|eukprot:KNE55494.1 hypothetical protein AMAG_01383 [Allomyces macrogynus ATCC 38327]
MIRIYLPSSLASCKLQTSLDFVISANPDDHHGGKGPTFTLRRMPKVDVTPSMPFVLMDATAADHLITMRRELLLKDKPEFPAERLAAAPAASSDHLQVPRKSPRAADLTPESVWVMEFASDSGESAVMDDVNMDRIAEIRSEHDLPLFGDELTVDHSFAFDLDSEPTPFSAPSPDPAPAVAVEASPAADATESPLIDPAPLEEAPQFDAVVLPELPPIEVLELAAIVPEPAPVESPALDAAVVVHDEVLEAPVDVRAAPAADNLAVETVDQPNGVESATAAVEDELPHIEAAHEPVDAVVAVDLAVLKLDAPVAEEPREIVELELTAPVEEAQPEPVHVDSVEEVVEAVTAEPAVVEPAAVEEAVQVDPIATLPAETAPAAETAVAETERDIAAEATVVAPAVPELVVIADAPAEPESAATTVTTPLTAPAPLSSNVHPSSSDAAETAPSLAVFADDNDDAHSTSVVPLFAPSDLLLDDASTRSMAGSLIPHHARSIISDRVEPATSPEPPVQDSDEDSAEPASQFQTIQDLIARLDTVDVPTPVLGEGLMVAPGEATTTAVAAEMSEDAAVLEPVQEEKVTEEPAKPESPTTSENPFLIATKLFDAMETHLFNLSLPDVHVTAPMDDAAAAPAEDAPAVTVRAATPVLSVTAPVEDDAESDEDEGMLSSAVDMEGFPKVPTLKSASSVLMDVPHYMLSTDDSEGDESHKDQDEMSSHEEEEESDLEEEQPVPMVAATPTVASPKLASPKFASPKPAAASPRFSTPALSTAALSTTVLSVPVLSAPASPAVVQAAPSPMISSPAVAHAASPVLTIPRLSVPGSPAVVTESLPSPTIPAPPALVAQPALAPSPIASTATPAEATIDPPSPKPVPELHYESFPPADLVPIAPAVGASSGLLPAIREDQDDSNPTSNTHTNGNDDIDEEEEDDDCEIEFSVDSAYETPSLGATPSSSAFEPAANSRKDKKDKKLLPRLRHSLQVTLRRASHSEPSTRTTAARRDSAPNGPLVMDLVPANSAPAKKRSLLRKMLDKFASSGSDDERDPRAAKQPKSKLFRKEKKDLGKRRGDTDEQAASSSAAPAEGGKKSKRFSVFKK